MKKKYIDPKVDVVKTGLESGILTGFNIGGGTDEGSNTKTHDFDLGDFIGKSMQGDETNGNNQQQTV